MSKSTTSYNSTSKFTKLLRKNLKSIIEINRFIENNSMQQFNNTNPKKYSILEIKMRNAYLDEFIGMIVRNIETGEYGLVRNVSLSNRTYDKITKEVRSRNWNISVILLNHAELDNNQGKSLLVTTWSPNNIIKVSTTPVEFIFNNMINLCRDI